jgi:hypothetical protein
MDAKDLAIVVIILAWFAIGVACFVRLRRGERPTRVVSPEGRRSP